MKLIGIVIVLLSVSLLGFGAFYSGKVHRQALEQPRLERVGDKTKELLSIVRDVHLRESDPQRVVKAIKQLGEMKSVASIDDLVKLLTFKQTFDWETADSSVISEIHPITPTERYPAAGALVQIGKPSLAPLAKVIETHETGSIESENSTFAVFAIFRANLNEGVAYFKAEASSASTSEGAKRLLVVSDRLEKLARN